MARTIYGMKIPVVSAVGHETDFTIADFVADVRAPTPSAAAELVTPELDLVLENLNEKFTRLNRSFNYILNEYRGNLNYIKRSLDFYSPIYQLKEKMQELDSIFRKLTQIMEAKLKINRDRLDNVFTVLNCLNPVTSLARGYSILLDENNNMISSVDSLSIGDELNLLIIDGTVKVKVIKIDKGEFTYE